MIVVLLRVRNFQAGIANQMPVCSTDIFWGDKKKKKKEVKPRSGLHNIRSGERALPPKPTAPFKTSTTRWHAQSHLCTNPTEKKAP